jgi:hypothetical protein
LTSDAVGVRRRLQSIMVKLEMEQKLND